MSSFLKKNPRLSGIIKSDENVQSVSNKTGTPGLTPSLTGASSLLASTGIPDLDVCLGGGLPPASLLTVFEDFPASKANFTWTALVRCFLAEGVATAATDWTRKDGGWVAMVGHDISGILSSLPKPEATNSSSNTNSSNNSPSNLDYSMKIAWRYEGMKEFDSNLKRPISALSSSSEKILGHTFDLGRRHEAIPKQLQDSSRALQLDLRDNENNACDYQRACKFVKESIHINQRSGLGRIVIGSLGVSGIWSCSCNNNINFSCGPAWLIKMISNYIQEIEASHPCLVLVTVPTAYLVDNLVIPGIGIQGTGGGGSRILPTWVSAVENVSDAVIELKPLAGLTFKSQSSSHTKSLLTREYDGFLLIRKALRRPNSFKPFIPETSNLAFKIKRRRFGIEKFHLPPSIDDSGAEAQTSLCSSSKGAASVNLSSKSSHPLDF
jgi:hypothetical protein